MFISPFRLLLLIFIAMVIGINISVLVNAWRESLSMTNPLLNVGGLVILAGFVFLQQWYQNRKSKKAKTVKGEA